MYNVLKSSQGTEVLVTDVKTVLISIKDEFTSLSSYLEEIINSVNNINHTIGSRFDNESTLYKLVSNIYLKCNSLYFSVRNIETYFKSFIETYFPISNGSSQITSWHNFWDSFNSLSLHDFIINIYNEIDNLTNPLSEQNKPAFDSALKSLNDNTIIGNVNDIKDTGQIIIDSMSGANPSAHYYVTTLPVSFCGATIPAKTIDIDLSWYGAYREQAFSILRSLILIGWFVIFFRRLPDLINGSGLSEFKQHNDDLADEAYEIVRSQQERGIGSE